MLKKMLLAFVLVSGSTAAMAQTSCSASPVTEKRQTELHDALQLTPAQEPVWSKFLAETKPPCPDDVQAAMAKMTTPERAEYRAKNGVAFATAIRSFYTKLTPAQQKAMDTFHPNVEHVQGPRKLGGDANPIKMPADAKTLPPLVPGTASHPVAPRPAVAPTTGK